MGDTLTILWKESHEILRTGGGSRQGRIGLLITPVVFGILLPAEFGHLWTDSPILLFFAILVPFSLVGTVVADSFAGERERHTLETLLASRMPDHAILFGKLIAAMAFGWGLELTALLLGLVTANLFHRNGGFLFYRADVGGGAVLLSLVSAGFASNFGVLISLRSPTVQQAQQIISYTIMLPGLLLAAIGVAIPGGIRRHVILALIHSGLFGIVLAASGAFLVFDAILLVLAVARFQRTRLSLD